MKTHICAALAGLVALIGATCLSTEAIAGDLRPGRLDFVILRNGEPSGRHTVNVTVNGDETRVDSAVSIDVNVGPLNLYRYRLNCSETWRANALQQMRCTTEKGGARIGLTARKTGEALLVEGAEGRAQFDASIVPANWWALSTLSSRQVFDAETGRAMPLRVSAPQNAEIALEGRNVRARQIRIAATMAADLWYDDAGRWVGCAFSTRGQNFEYRLVSPLAEAPSRT